MVVHELDHHLLSAVELRLGKICGGLPQDLIRAFQLSHFPLERLHTLALVRGQPGALARIARGLAHPLSQRLGGAAELARNRRHRRPRRRVLGDVLLEQPDGPLADLRGIPKGNTDSVVPWAYPLKE